MSKDKISLKDMIAYEKAKMLPLHFMMSYIVTPIYVLTTVLLIGTFAVLMEIDEQKYLVHGLLCLGAFVLITVVLLSAIPLVRKKAISIELARYDFDTSKEPALEKYDFSTEELAIIFDQHGMRVNDKLHYYNHLTKTVVITNDRKRIGIYLQFSVTQEHYIMLYVNPTTLKMLECLQIRMDNHKVLEQILSNPRKAFEQIYDKGEKL